MSRAPVTKFQTLVTLSVRLAAAAVVLLVADAAARAQWNVSSSSRSSSSSSSGTFGSRSVGSSNARFTNAGIGQSARSGTSMGTSQRGASSQYGSRGQSGGNPRAGQFVGADTQDVQNFMSQMGASRGSSGRGANATAGSRRSGQAGQNRQPGQPGQEGAMGRSTVSEIRTSLLVGFDYPRLTPSRVAADLTRRLARSTTIHSPGPVDVTLDGQTVVLRGTVATPHARLVVEQLARLEPGVEQVRNELTVSPSPAPGAATPAEGTPTSRPPGSPE